MGRGIMIIPRLSTLACLLGVSMTLSPMLVLSDEPQQRRFYFGGDLGVAYMDIERGDTNYSDTWLFGALRAEYALHPRLLLGAEGAGWTDQVTASSSISEDVISLMVTARAYPMQNSDVFVKAGWGHARHRYWESSTQSDASGPAYLVALGYGVHRASFSISYSSGNLDQETYKAVTVSAGFTF